MGWRIVFFNYLAVFGLVLFTCAFPSRANNLDNGLQTVYLTESCNTQLSGSSAGRIESSKALSYSNNMDCTVTITVPVGKKILLYFPRFDLEPAKNGNCSSDVVHLYDGLTTDSLKLAGKAGLCGRRHSFKYTSSQNKVRLDFKTDAKGVRYGFSMLYTAFEDGPPCPSGHFPCDDGGYCISTDNQCNGVNQCGDRSDEADKYCLNPSNQNSTADTGISLETLIPIIIGASIGFIVLAVLLPVIVINIRKHRKWKRFLKEQRENMDKPKTFSRSKSIVPASYYA